MDKHDLNNAVEAQDESVERAVWTRPELSRFKAGSAETNPSVSTDFAEAGLS